MVEGSYTSLNNYYLKILLNKIRKIKSWPRQVCEYTTVQGCGDWRGFNRQQWLSLMLIMFDSWLTGLLRGGEGSRADLSADAVTSVAALTYYIYIVSLRL